MPMNHARPTRYRVTGMDCGACAAKVDAAVRRMERIESVSVSATTGILTVGYTGDEDLLPLLQCQLAPLGYEVALANNDLATPTPSTHACGNQCHDKHCHGKHTVHRSRTPQSVPNPWWTNRKTQRTAACGMALLLAYVVGWWLVPQVERWAFAIALLVGLVPIARRSIAGIRVGVPFTIETLLTISAVGGFVIDATDEAATLVFLFLLGEHLEGIAARRARTSIEGLRALIPSRAIVEHEDHTEEMDATDIPCGAVILVRPGDRLAADGLIVNGEGAVDESPITGESMPKHRGVGDRVYAGTINRESVLRVRVTAIAADNTIARVVKLVEEAQESKAPTERFIDRFARYYTPAVFAAGVLVACGPPLLLGMEWVEWVYKGLAVLLIGCPCALVISTPAAIAAALSTGARGGLLFKGGAVLEAIGKTSIVAFDKTGTLTSGKPVVTDVVGFGRTQSHVLSMAAAMEHGSSHPLALAIVQHASEQGVVALHADDLQVRDGTGVVGQVDGARVFLGSARGTEGAVPLEPEHATRIAALTNEGKTVSVLRVGSEIVGLLAMRDEPRIDAAAGLAALHREGVSTVMLTGDDRRTANAIAKGLGIEAHAELMPEDKQLLVMELRGRGEHVVVVGDGINDAPALASADVGVAMGGGTDVALETADAAVLHGRVGDVARMVRLSKRTMGNIRQNVVIALGLKVVFLVTTLVGVTGLWMAILADTGATVLVTLNALRLLRGNGRGGWREGR